MIKRCLLISSYLLDGMVSVFNFLTEEYTLGFITFTPIEVIFGGALIVYLAWLILNALW